MERLGFTNRPAERISSGAQESNEMSNVMPASNISSPTQFLETKKGKYAYRRFGNGPGLPLLFLQHFTGTLDNWDPAVTDPLTTSQVFSPKPSRNASACSAMPATVSGTLPLERPSPALSNRMTSRPVASGSITAGSQLSSVPVKC